MNSSIKYGVGLLSILSAATSMPAMAQGTQHDEVVVTATRRAESVQDVAVTLTVLGSEQITKADINDATGIAVNTPGLAYGEFSPGQAIFSMRGIGSADDGAGWIIRSQPLSTVFILVEARV